MEEELTTLWIVRKGGEESIMIIPHLAHKTGKVLAPKVIWDDLCGKFVL